MAEIVNLRHARKTRRRRQAAEVAAENRTRFGRPKPERRAEAAERARDDATHAGHRLEKEEDGERG